MGFSKASDGFYTATPTAGWRDGYGSGPPASNVTMIIFVSSVSGKDPGDGGFNAAIQGSFAQPYRTLDMAFTRTGGQGYARAGSPDWILLATGETWTGQLIANTGVVDLGPGLDEQNRMVYSSYDKTANISAPNNPPIPNPATGVVARPIVIPPISQWARGVNFIHAYTAIMGIDFYCSWRDTAANPANANNWALSQAGIGVQNDTRPGNILVEDCISRNFSDGIMVDSINSIPESGPFSVRRNIVINNWGDKYGIGTWKMTPSFLIEENLVDLNGWDPIGQPDGSGLNHNLYVSGNNQLHPYDGGTYYDGFALSDLYFHGNISTNSLMQENNRCGGHFNNNLWQIGGHGGTNFGANNPAVANLIENEVAIGGFLGGPTHVEYGQNWLEAGTAGPDDQLGYWGELVPGIQHVNINNCIVTQGYGNSTCAIELKGWTNGVTVTGCLQYKFSGTTVVSVPYGSYIDGGGNLGTTSPSQAAAWGWTHPERTPATYMAEVIHDGSTMADFVRRCRLQSRRNWNPLLMAESVNDYVRQGFNKPMIGSAYASSTGAIFLAPLPSTGTVGTPYSGSASASGGTAPYTYLTIAGALPTGLNPVNSSTGAVTGTPTVAGTFNFTIRATDSTTANGQQSYTVTIASSGGGTISATGAAAGHGVATGTIVSVGGPTYHTVRLQVG